MNLAQALKFLVVLPFSVGKSITYSLMVPTCNRIILMVIAGWPLMMLEKLDKRLELAKIICEYVGQRCVLCEEKNGIPTKILESPWWQYVCVVCVAQMAPMQEMPTLMMQTFRCASRSADSEGTEVATSPRSALSDDTRIFS